MTQAKIREDILNIVNGNIRYADPQDELCKEATARYNREKVGQEGYTIQSAEEVLDDIICDLKALQDELRIESSFQSAQLWMII